MTGMPPAAMMASICTSPTDWLAVNWSWPGIQRGVTQMSGRLLSGFTDCVVGATIGERARVSSYREVVTASANPSK